MTYSLPVTVVFLVAGILLLYFCGGLIVRGASNLAVRKGLSRMTVGLTVVALGTSAPELFVSLLAALEGSTAISVGNVVGSNIANIALVLGLAVTVRPLPTSGRSLKMEMPFVLASSLLFYFMALDGTIGRLDGGLLLGLFGLFMFYCFKNRLEVDPAPNPTSGMKGSLSMDCLYILAGLVGLALGSDLFVKGASSLARHMGVSELVIGLTIVALGTSLPELAASAMAALKKEMDLSVGNLIGSNIFNVLFIMGTVSAINPLPCPAESVRIDFPLMIGVSVMALVFMATGRRLTRWEGVCLLMAYGGYLATMGFRSS